MNVLALPAGRAILVGFRRWKAYNLAPILVHLGHAVRCADNAAAAARLAPAPQDGLYFWGAQPPAGLAALALASGARLLRMEDGFVRSVGLGSDLIRPLSLVLDPEGMYFDPSRPSALENLLNTSTFSSQELAQAAQARAFMVQHGITKYNTERRQEPRWAAHGRRVVLVPGQVEDDASIQLGCVDVRTNLGLLQAAREAQPDAFVVFKPHPDVLSGNRRGRVGLADAMRYADHVETQVSVTNCLQASDEVHTLTSLAGFDALLRGKRVVVYGQPFYAGWGLTHDKVPKEQGALARRKRQCALDELVAGALLRYPLYWDWNQQQPTTCLAVLQQLLEERTRLERSGGLEKLRTGWLRRQGRKIRTLYNAWTGHVG
jgi:capsular polysaccharide export protein